MERAFRSAHGRATHSRSIGSWPHTRRHHQRMGRSRGRLCPRSLRLPPLFLIIAHGPLSLLPMTTITTAPPARHPLPEIIHKVTSSYLLRRLAKALFSIWLVITITFFMIRALPGNAVDVLIQELTAQGMSPDDARNQAAS